MTLFLVRHGQTAYNIQRRFLGRTDLPLDEEGQAQARCLAKAGLPAGILYSSPLLRARQTATVLGTPLLVEGLVEMDMGELEGLSREEMEERFPGLLSVWFADPTHFRPPGGETLSETQARAQNTLMALEKKDGPVVVVSHQLVIASLLCWISGEPLSRFRQFSHGNTGYSVLDWEGDRFRISAFNQMDHLSP